ncbi:MAG: VOC family protein [Candidatus Eisenbacteria bacterium]|nr:VOC family protein [Candidatus Eisenbacteria bacterium]
MLRVTHFELPADDPEKLVEFYENVFGWTARKWNGPMDYWLVMTGPQDQPGIDGGIARRGEGDAGPINSIDVPSVDEYVAKIEKGGGSVIVPKMKVPGVGYLAYCKDPEGNVFGIMQEDTAVK